MAGKRHEPDEIIQKFWHVDVLVGQGMLRSDTVRQVRITEVRSGIQADLGQMPCPWGSVAASKQTFTLP